MEEIGMFEAKTKFSEIVKRVQATGRAIRVTNRGKPVVEIAPVQREHKNARTRREVFAELARLRDTLAKSSREEIRRDIDEGRM